MSPTASGRGGPRAAATLPDGASGPDPGADWEDACWRRWRCEGDGNARTRLVEHHAPFARRLAARLFARRVGYEVEFDDYLQFAMVGLLEALERFELGRGVPFRAYAAVRIQGAIRNGVQRLTERQQRYAARQRLAAERLTSVIPEELATAGDEQLIARLGDVGVSVAIALILEGTGLEAGAKPGLSTSAYERAELRQLGARAWEAVERLPERERQVLSMHYRAGVAFADVAEALGVTKGRISQLHRQALERLRTQMTRAERCDVAF